MKHKSKLHKELIRVEEEIAENKNKISELGKEQTRLMKELELIKEKIEKASEEQSKVEISDHALLRYIQRALGINVEEIRGEMSIHLKINCDGKFPMPNGTRAVVKDGVAVTVV